MPIWLRKYTFNTILEYYQEKNEKEEQQIKKANSSASKIKTPSYKVKAPNK